MRKQAFRNRPYMWFDVPQEFAGWWISQSKGGELVETKQPTTIHLVMVKAADGIKLDGWNPIDGATFGYTDNGRTAMQVYARELAVDEEILLPQGNWTGGLLLLPQQSVEPDK